MFGTDNTLKVLIGKANANIVSNNSVQITNPGGANYIADGQIVILAGSKDTVVTSSNASTFVGAPIRFAQRSGNYLSFSPRFQTTFAAYDEENWLTAGEQTDIIGYNPNTSTGAINVVNHSQYELEITNLFDDKLFAEQFARRIYSYSTGTADTQLTIAQGFVNQINADPASFIKAELTGDGILGSGLSGTGAALLFTNGSTQVGFYTAPLVASTGSVAVGTMLSVPSSEGKVFTYTVPILDTVHLYIGTTVYTGVPGATLVTSVNTGTQAVASYETGVLTITILEDNGQTLVPYLYDNTGSAIITPTIVTTNMGDATPVIYTVATAASTAATFTLTTPFTGGTGYVPIGTSSLVYNTQSVTPSNYGVKLTGEQVNWADYGLFPYKRVVFSETLLNFGTTPVVTSATTQQGTGNYKQVRDLEWFALGGDGIRNDMWHPIPTGRHDATAYTPYNIYAINYSNINPIEVVSGSKPSRGQIIIATAQTPITGDTQDSNITTLLGDLSIATFGV
jgi:hypothetical protein